MAKEWRGFASDFAGPGEIRFEDFEGKGSTDGKGLGASNWTASKTWDGRIVMDESARQERLQVLKRKLRDQQERQKKADERRKERDKQMAEQWLEHVKELEEQKANERKERLKALEESTARAKEAQAQRDLQNHAAQAKAAENAKVQDVEDLNFFLTGLATSSSEPRKSTLKPTAATEEKKEKTPRKPGLPPEAMPSLKKKQHESGIVDKQRDKSSVIQQLPQLFPGLKRTSEGKQILENAEPQKSMAEKQPITKEHLLRKAQIKLMDQLAAQVSEYRKSMKSKMFSPISPNHDFGESQLSPRFSEGQVSVASPSQSRLSRNSLRSMGMALEDLPTSP